MQDCGFIHEDHLNYLIDLDRPLEAIFEGIGRRTRKNIRHGLNHGEVVIEEVKDREQVAICFQLLQQTYRGAGVPLADRTLFEAAYDLLQPRGMIRFTLASINGKPAAVSVDLIYKDCIYGWYGGTDRACSAHMPNELLMWHILKWGAENGYRVYDFGGAGKPSEPYGVRDFKSKFGGTLVCFGRNTCVHTPLMLSLAKLGYGLLKGRCPSTPVNRRAEEKLPHSDLRPCQRARKHVREDPAEAESAPLASAMASSGNRPLEGRIASPWPPRGRFVGRLAELFEDWGYLLRRDGWRSALPVVAREIAELPYRRLRFVVMKRSLQEPLPELEPKAALGIRPFALTDLDAVRRMNRPSEARLCARRLACGYEGMVATYSGEVVGYAFNLVYSSGKSTLEDVALPLEEGDVLCADAYSDPHFRGRGVQTALLLALLRRCRHLGLRASLCYIQIHNSPPLAIWRKMGALQLGRIDFRRVGPWRRSVFVETPEYPTHARQPAVLSG